MDEEKYNARDLIGKMVLSKSGRKFGVVSDILFETTNGELMNVVLKQPTKYSDSLGLERNKQGETLIPFHAVEALGDFIVINEDDLF